MDDFGKKRIIQKFFFKCILKNIDDFEIENISQYASEKKKHDVNDFLFFPLLN